MNLITSVEIAVAFNQFYFQGGLSCEKKDFHHDGPDIHRSGYGAYFIIKH